MSRVGTVKQIWRFPVKSMQGDTVSSAQVSSQGLVGDRVWAMRDEVRREVQWGKMYPQLMLCKARYRDEPEAGSASPVDIRFPDGETVGSDDPRIHEKLTALIGRAARLWPLQPAGNLDFYKRYKPDEEKFAQEMAGLFAREGDEPLPDFATFPAVLMDFVAVPGTFFDNEEINLMTTASLAHMQARNPSADWDVRRFRPNLLIETAPAIDGLAETTWLGRKLRIGGLTLEITMATPRCGMTVQPQDGLEYDKTILRTIVREGAQCLGVGAHCLQAGTVTTGDSVELMD